jgi:hypothetical protein
LSQEKEFLKEATDWEKRNSIILSRFLKNAIKLITVIFSLNTDN